MDDGFKYKAVNMSSPRSVIGVAEPELKVCVRHTLLPVGVDVSLCRLESSTFCIVLHDKPGLGFLFVILRPVGRKLSSRGMIDLDPGATDVQLGVGEKPFDRAHVVNFLRVESKDGAVRRDGLLDVPYAEARRRSNSELLRGSDIHLGIYDTSSGRLKAGEARAIHPEVDIRKRE
jgi:hypothetical protein